jgi:hypothetical protein
VTNSLHPWPERHVTALRHIWPQHTSIATAVAAFRCIIRRPAADVIRQAVSLGLATEAEARATYPWSPLQDAALVALVLQGFAFEVIAEKMDRHRTAIAERLAALRHRGWKRVLCHLRSHPEAGTRTGAQVGRLRFTPWSKATAGEKAYLRLRVPMAENFDQAVGWAMKRLRRPEAQVRWMIASISTTWGDAVHIDGIDRHLWPAGWDARMVTAFTTGKTVNEVARWLHRGNDEIALRWHLLHENPRRLQVVRGLLGELPQHLPDDPPTAPLVPATSSTKTTAKERPWKAADVRNLRRAMLDGASLRIIALLLDRDEGAITDHMARLGITLPRSAAATGHGSSWTTSERRACLLALGRRLPVATVAERLGRTVNAVLFEVRRSGLPASVMNRLVECHLTKADLVHLRKLAATKNRP